MSYTELVRPIRAGRGGEYITKNSDAIAPMFLQALVNCTLENDAWETELGTRRLNTNPIGSGPIIGTVVQYVPSPGVMRLIACGRDGTVWKSSDEGMTWTLLKDGLASNRLIVPVECGQESAGRPKKLILFGASQPLVLVGDATLDAGVADPTSPLVVLNAGPGVNGAVTLGVHRYGYSWRTAVGETGLSPVVSLEVSSANNAKVNGAVLSGPPGTVIQVYRSRANESDLFRLMVELTPVSDGAATFVDNTPDSELGTIIAPVHNSTPSIHPLSRPPIDWAEGNWPTAAIMAQGRLFGFGNNNAPHQAYLGDRFDHEDFLSAPKTFSFFSGTGDGLTAAVFWRKNAWFWKKPRGIYRVDTTNLDPNQWPVLQHTLAVGCPGPMALTLIQGADETQFYDDVIFVAPDASIHRLSKVDAYQEGDVNASSISEKTYAPFLRDRVDKTRLEFTQAIYFDQIEEVWFAFSQNGSVVNNLRVKCSLKRLPEFGPRFYHSVFPECEGLALAINPDASRTPLAGGSGGIVRRLHELVYADAGTAYQSEWWTHDDNFQDLGEEHKLAKKNYHFLVIEGESVGDWSMTVHVYLDGILQPTALSIPMLGKGQQFVLDESELDVGTLDAPTPIRVVKRLRGRGTRISFRGFINTAGNWFRITHVLIGYSLSGFHGGNKR